MGSLPMDGAERKINVSSYACRVNPPDIGLWEGNGKEIATGEVNLATHKRM